MHCLNRVIATVNIIAHEHIACIWDFATAVEELNKIVELTMDVTADGDGSLDRLAVRLFDENLFNLFTE